MTLVLAMSMIQRLLPSIESVKVEQVTLESSFLDYVSGVFDVPGTVALISGNSVDNDPNDSARYHIVGMYPWLIIHSKNKITSITIKDEIAGDKTFKFNESSFCVLKEILSNFNYANSVVKVADSVDLNLKDLLNTLPFIFGFMGYLSYDLNQHLDSIPKTCVDDLLLPDLYMCAPSVVCIHDTLNNNSFISTVSLSNSKMRTDAELLVRKFLDKSCFYKVADNCLFNSGCLLSEPVSNMGRSRFVKAVHTARSYIAKGDVFQINLSHRFKSNILSHPFDIFRYWYEQNPAPFFAYVNASPLLDLTPHNIISTSPERFLCRFKDVLETKPIKGTRPRGETLYSDRELKDILHNSKKDDAELTMIVDLVRNDLAKVCLPGTINVSSHKMIESYKNVHHLVSTVRGLLEPTNDSVDAIKALFPGGSITGCPKLRAMELIDELEMHQRHVYTGSIGYISFHETFDLSIAIRTGICVGNTMYFSVGSGIVFDSDPEQEYQETLDKAHAVYSLSKIVNK